MLTTSILNPHKIRIKIAYMFNSYSKMGLLQILCKVQTRVKYGSCGERFCSLLFNIFQYNRNKAKNQALIR